MVSVLKLCKSLLHGVMKLAGMRSRVIEIEPGTVMNFWVPTETKKHSKPVVIFLHGFAGDGIITWAIQVLAVAKTYAVYVPDFLFFGGSFTDKAERSVGFQAECTAKALAKIGVQSCILVGFSYGGFVGFKMAEMYPELVESMVVTCSVMALTESISSAALKRIGFSSWTDYLLPTTVEGVTMLYKVACFKLPMMPDFVYKDYLKTMFNNRKEQAELLEALVVRDKEFVMPHLRQRIHLIWGENDLIFNMDTARNVKDQMGEGARLHCIGKAGHVVQIERPLMYNRQLKKILASLSQDN